MGWLDIAFPALIVALVIADLVVDARRAASTERALAYLVGMHQLEAQARTAEPRPPAPGVQHKLAPAYQQGDGWYLDCRCGWGGGPSASADEVLDAGEQHIRSISRGRRVA